MTYVCVWVMGHVVETLHTGDRILDSTRGENFKMSQYEAESEFIKKTF